MFKSSSVGRDEKREEGERLFYEGIAAASRYECTKAISLYSKSIEMSANPAPYINRAKLLTWRQRYIEAFADLQKAQSLDEAQGREFTREIEEEIYKVKPICHHYFSENRETMIEFLREKMDDPYYMADVIEEVWREVLISVKKSHLYRSISRFHFFNELDSIKKFSGFDFYPTVEGYWAHYPDEFIDLELSKGCPDSEAYVLVCAHVGSALCLLEEREMASYREATLYRIHGELMSDDYGIWGTFDSEDRGIIRDAADFADANPHLAKF